MEKLSDIQQVNQAIMFGNFTNTELSSIMSAVQFARAGLTKQIKHSIGRGSLVKFTSTRNGQTYQGTVEKVAIKYATVNTATGRFKVPMSMLVTA
jgi:hypothetical protein